MSQPVYYIWDPHLSFKLRFPADHQTPNLSSVLHRFFVLLVHTPDQVQRGVWFMAPVLKTIKSKGESCVPSLSLPWTCTKLIQFINRNREHFHGGSDDLRGGQLDEDYDDRQRVPGNHAHQHQERRLLRNRLPTRGRRQRDHLRLIRVACVSYETCLHKPKPPLWWLRFSSPV